MFAVCHIIAAYSQQKLKLFSSTRYYSPSIRNKNLVLDTVRCIFLTVTLTFYVFAECSSKDNNALMLVVCAETSFERIF